MNTFTPAQIEHFRREAKQLSRKSPTSLSHSQALDRIAVEHGHANWSRLAKASQVEARLLSSIELNNKPFPGGSFGIYVVTIKVVDQDLLARIAHEVPHFRLPVRAGWLFRPVTLPQNRFAPYLDLTLGYLQGIIVEGEWTAILSRNGIQDHEIDRHIETTLPEVLRALRMQAAVTLSQWQKAPTVSAAPRFRLFFVDFH